jgi:hypothetical protein
MASGLEADVVAARGAWGRSDNSIAQQALSLLKEALKDHRSKQPDCPHQ